MARKRHKPGDVVTFKPTPDTYMHLKITGKKGPRGGRTVPTSGTIHYIRSPRKKK